MCSRVDSKSSRRQNSRKQRRLANVAAAHLDILQITLLSPDLRAGRTEACMSTIDNNLEWSVQLAPGEQRDLVVKWTLEAPQNSSIVVVAAS